MRLNILRLMNPLVEVSGPAGVAACARAWSLEIGTAFHGSVVRRDRSGEPRRWVASINSTALGEFVEREIAMDRVEGLSEASMVLVLHDWPAYGRNGNRRQAVKKF